MKISMYKILNILYRAFSDSALIKDLVFILCIHTIFFLNLIILRKYISGRIEKQILNENKRTE